MSGVRIEEITKRGLDRTSSVYGPVPSWRVGASLGIDLLCINSICSFNCSYCQLGFIQVRINQRALFVPTEKVMQDLGDSRWKEADIVTFSGSGEPTLAENLGECIDKVSAFTGIPVLVLTNGTLIHRDDVREELCRADRVYLKLDAATDSAMARVNRPVAGVSLERIIEGACGFREEYEGFFALQIMFVHSNIGDVDVYADLIHRLNPDEVQVNTPTRPYPNDWYLDSRGSHEGVDYPAKPIKQIDVDRLDEVVDRLKRLTSGSGARVISVRRR